MSDMLTLAKGFGIGAASPDVVATVMAGLVLWGGCQMCGMPEVS